MEMNGTGLRDETINMVLMETEDDETVNVGPVETGEEEVSGVGAEARSSWVGSSNERFRFHECSTTTIPPRRGNIKKKIFKGLFSFH
uniref:Uncharacterized protein n=1 Tax=Nelumbo nucifera TaxID=4432 RepID=A0A822XT26_NELNU|nr:TPA_asm: hypothetical protein HUJ06_026219 [Nelumbo nucifera]DAD24764.1 TPA_asm: hypothetical protein HUJ06_026228 [Nelumbo nucifera]